VAGIAISLFTPGASIHDPKTFQVIAEVGDVFLMFSIGLEFSLEESASVKWVALIGGPLGIVLSVLLGAGVGWLFGWDVVTWGGCGTHHRSCRHHGLGATAD
jgi:CPA2 family monovalent cation:H+ antiporter-2